LGWTILSHPFYEKELFNYDAYNWIFFNKYVLILQILKYKIYESEYVLQTHYLINLSFINIYNLRNGV